MDDLFLKVLISAWPFLIPTASIVIAYYGLRKKHKESLDTANVNKVEADLRDERLRSEIGAVQHEVTVSKFELKGEIERSVNGKLERIEGKLDRIGDRVVTLETNVAAFRKVN